MKKCDGYKLVFKKTVAMLTLAHMYLGLDPLPGGFAFTDYPKMFPAKKGKKYKDAVKRYLKKLEEIDNEM